MFSEFTFFLKIFRRCDHVKSSYDFPRNFLKYRPWKLAIKICVLLVAVDEFKGTVFLNRQRYIPTICFHIVNVIRYLHSICFCCS